MIKRTLYHALQRHLDQKEISLLVGPRQAGKTTLMLALKRELERRQQKTMYLNLDIEADKEHVISQARLVKKIELAIGRQSGYVFLDEIQRKQDAGAFLKGLYDMRLPYKLVVSGSGALELKEKIHESLAGRKRVFELLTLSFEEFLHARTGYHYEGRLADFLAVERTKTKELLDEYLRFGGYPRVADESVAAEKKEIIKEIYQSYLEKDITALLQVKKTEAFTRFVKVAASQIGRLTKFSEMSATLGLAEQTIRDYFWYLEKTFIVDKVTPFHTNVRKELTKAPVFYFLDLGLRNYALDIFGAASLPQDAGYVFQNFVFRILKEKLQDTAAGLHFWRTADGAEVDFVIHSGDTLVPMEVKYQALTEPRIPRSLTSFISRYRPARAYLVNLELAKEVRYEATTIIVLPFDQLLVQKILS